MRLYTCIIVSVSVGFSRKCLISLALPYVRGDDLLHCRRDKHLLIPRESETTYLTPMFFPMFFFEATEEVFYYLDGVLR